MSDSLFELDITSRFHEKKEEQKKLNEMIAQKRNNQIPQRKPIEACYAML